MPSFIMVGECIGAAFMCVTIFFNQLNGNLYGFTSSMGTFCGDTTNTVAYATIFHLFILFNRVTTVIGCNQYTGFIKETVGKTIAFRCKRLRPPVTQCLRYLGNFGGCRFVFNHFAFFVCRSRHPILTHENTTVIVLVVTNNNFAGG